jgi:PAS domain S-box-containing protein
MKKSQDQLADAAALRRRAEEQMKLQRPVGGGQRTELETARLVHELQVHQVELEMQNEELKTSRAKVDAGLALYADLYDFAPTGYLTLDREGTIRLVNLIGARLLGVERSRLVQRRFGQFVVESDRRAFSDFLEKVFGSEAKECCEVTLLREGLQPLTVHIEGTRSAEGQDCRAVMLDITERKRAETALRMSEARSRSLVEIIESTPDFVGMVDSLGHVLYLNCGGRRMVGLTDAADISRLSIADFHPPEVTARVVAQALPTAAQAGVWSGETILRTRAGREVHGLQIIVAHKKSQGVVECFSTVIHDLTGRKKLEAQLLRTQRLESVGQLASGIAHDLNNILAPILMATPLLQETVHDPSSRKIVDIINANAVRGAAIIKQLLTFGRGAGNQPGPRQLRSLIRDMENIIEETFPKNIRYQNESRSETWEAICDPTQLYQVLMNLCVNARDAMPDGGTLTLGVENVEVDEARAATIPGVSPGRYVVLSVADTGTGIAPELLDKIYDPFFTTKEIGRGTGLGLSTVLGIVKNHQGFVQVKTELGRGTRFQVLLPACAAEYTAPVPAAPETLPQGHGELVLVVDDEENVRQVTGMILEAYGYRVIDFGAAPTALNWYANHGAEAQVVISDMLMPGMDGVTFVRKLRHLNPQVLIITASGNQPGAGASETTAGETQACLIKPFTLEMLLRTLHCVLHPSEPGAPGA